MVFGTLGANLIGNLLKCKEVEQSQIHGRGVMCMGKGTIRAGEATIRAGQDFWCHLVLYIISKHKNMMKPKFMFLQEIVYQK